MPAPVATVSVSNSFLTRNVSSSIPICRLLVAQFAAGIAKTTYYFQMIQSLAAHYKFDIEIPFNELSEELREVILFGSGKEKVEFHYANSRGLEIKQLHRFEGVIPNLDRRYRETESSAVREELTRFLNSRPCPECKGHAPESFAARNVFVTDLSLPEISDMSVGHARSFFQNAATRRLAGHDRRQDCERNRRASQVFSATSASTTSH